MMPRYQLCSAPSAPGPQNGLLLRIAASSFRLVQGGKGLPLARRLDAGSAQVAFVDLPDGRHGEFAGYLNDAGDESAVSVPSGTGARVESGGAGEDVRTGYRAEVVNVPFW